MLARQLYTVAAVVSILARLPWWLVASVVPGLRPRRSWTVKAAFMTRLSRAGIDVQCNLGTTATVSLEPGREGDRFCVFGPFEDDVYVGPLSPRAAAGDGATVIRPGKTGGTWYPQRPSDGGEPPKTVVMHVHGGGFVVGDSRDYCQHLAKTLLSVAKVDAVFCPEYRLSGKSLRTRHPIGLGFKRAIRKGKGADVSTRRGNKKDTKGPTLSQPRPRTC